MAKKMVINAAVCDMRKVTEETLAAHEEIEVNAAMVLISQQAKALIAKYPVKLNCADTIEIEGDVKVSTVNGSAEINSNDVPGDNIYLTVNGSLQIGPDTEEVLKRYVGITVNGTVTYPKSMSGYVSALRLNGAAVCYPDGAVLLKRTAVIDKMFLLRAQPKLYWAAKRMILVDPQLDGKALAEKGVTFSTKEAIIAESLVEQVVGLFDESTDIQIVPDGTAVVRDDLTLNEPALRRYGGKLYIIGDLTLEKESRELLPKLEYLHVKGDVQLPASLVEDFTAIEAEYGDLQIVKGKVICDRPVVKVTRWMLEREEEGVMVVDCAVVKLDRDIAPELIAERLSIRDCAAVKCTPEQEGAVTIIAEDVAQINNGTQDGDDDSQGLDIGGMVKNMFSGDCKMVNAAKYVM